MRFLICILFMCCFLAAKAQRTSRFFDVTAGGGVYRGTLSMSYHHQWSIGKKQKLNLGIGARATSFLGADIYYVTAPAKLTSGSTGPLVLFKENIAANIDTFLLNSPQVNLVNLLIIIEYGFTKKFSAGFNIDRTNHLFNY